MNIAQRILELVTAATIGFMVVAFFAEPAKAADPIETARQFGFIDMAVSSCIDSDYPIVWTEEGDRLVTEAWTLFMKLPALRDAYNAGNRQFSALLDGTPNNLTATCMSVDSMQSMIVAVI